MSHAIDYADADVLTTAATTMKSRRESLGRAKPQNGRQKMRETGIYLI